MTITRTCAYAECGKPFTVSSRHIYYCCRECCHTDHGLVPKNRVGDIVKCAIKECGKEFAYTKGNRKYCSPACANAGVLLSKKRARRRAMARVMI